jgi:hypothetical protein
MRAVAEWFQNQFAVSSTHVSGNFCRDGCITPHEQRTRGDTMFSCDYNGWADVPEEEREGIDAFEAAIGEQSGWVNVPLVLPQPLPVREAARRAA